MTPKRADELRAKAHALARLESPRGLLQFLDHVVVDAQPVKRPFRTIAESWQWDRVLRSKDALEHLAGVTTPGSYKGVLSFWNEYHKGSDKTHDTARELLWLLAFSRRRLNLYVCAGGLDQAALITTAMKGTVLDNPWLDDMVSVTELTASGRSGSDLTVMPMNAWGGQGVFPDYMLAEEVTHWQHDEGRQFWNFVLSSANKRPSCVLKVNTNAGHRGSWQWKERNRVKESPYWGFYSAPVGKPLPTWMNQDKIDDDSKGMDPGERDRLYKNRWVDPGEENGYLTLEEADACVDHSLTEQSMGSRHTQYVISIDYGGVRDRCSLAVMHAVPGTQEVVVDRLDCWQGSHEDRVPLLIDPDEPDRRSVEGWMDMVLKRFRVLKIVADPAQMEALLIKYERRGHWCERFAFRSGRGNHRMAQALKHHVQSGHIKWSPSAGLLPPRDGLGRTVEDQTFSQELSLLVVKPTIYGYRFDHESGRHDDRACAVAMGLLHLLPDSPPPGGQGPKIPNDPGKPCIRAVPQPDRDYASGWNLMGVNRR